ncbi:hypothetical protein HYH03_010479 [Edaphochlamys debaryana]|uniref:Uncharacterized protein n=1 Tax=Edaphochlamys debaryana TaxID=47281 RepID=A0A835XZ11_9CHLO|nr:hypothetical protein HYH03_010479 [Edaphochlamys debaryana]|eukprot:KAG2491031.1 hypothetical protein HYH03_010479 [Edaphochlamys debaryana]
MTAGTRFEHHAVGKVNGYFAAEPPPVPSVVKPRKSSGGGVLACFGCGGGAVRHEAQDEVAPDERHRTSAGSTSSTASARPSSSGAPASPASVATPRVEVSEPLAVLRQKQALRGKPGASELHTRTGAGGDDVAQPLAAGEFGDEVAEAAASGAATPTAGETPRKAGGGGAAAAQALLVSAAGADGQLGAPGSPLRPRLPGGPAALPPPSASHAPGLVAAHSFREEDAAHDAALAALAAAAQAGGEGPRPVVLRRGASCSGTEVMDAAAAAAAMAAAEAHQAAGGLGVRSIVGRRTSYAGEGSSGPMPLVIGSGPAGPTVLRPSPSLIRPVGASASGPAGSPGAGPAPMLGELPAPLRNSLMRPLPSETPLLRGAGGPGLGQSPSLMRGSVPGAGRFAGLGPCEVQALGPEGGEDGVEAGSAAEEAGPHGSAPQLRHNGTSFGRNVSTAQAVSAMGAPLGSMRRGTAMLPALPTETATALNRLASLQMLHRARQEAAREEAAAAPPTETPLHRASDEAEGERADTLGELRPSGPPRGSTASSDSAAEVRRSASVDAAAGGRLSALSDAGETRSAPRDQDVAFGFMAPSVGLPHSPPRKLGSTAAVVAGRIASTAGTGFVPAAAPAAPPSHGSLLQDIE